MNLPVETSVAELAELVVDLTGSSSRIIYGPLPIDDPIQRCPDIGQASALLDWKPRTELLGPAATNRLFRGSAQWLARTVGRGDGRRRLTRATRLPRLASSSTANTADVHPHDKRV